MGYGANVFVGGGPSGRPAIVRLGHTRTFTAHELRDEAGRRFPSFWESELPVCASQAEVDSDTCGSRIVEYPPDQ